VADAERRGGFGVLGVERRWMDIFEERHCGHEVALSQQQVARLLRLVAVAVLGTERQMPNRERFRKRPFNCA
jgi:hypothetical protein